MIRLHVSFMAKIGQPVDLQIAALAGVERLQQRPGFDDNNFQSPGGAWLVCKGALRHNARQWSVHAPVRSPYELRWAYDRIMALALASPECPLTVRRQQDDAPSNARCWLTDVDSPLGLGDSTHSVTAMIEELGMWLAHDVQRLEAEAEKARAEIARLSHVQTACYEARQRIERVRERLASVWMPRRSRTQIEQCLGPAASWAKGTTFNLRKANDGIRD